MARIHVVVLLAAAVRALGAGPAERHPPPPPPDAPLAVQAEYGARVNRLYVGSLACFDLQRRTARSWAGRTGPPGVHCTAGPPTPLFLEGGSPTGLACAEHGHAGAPVMREPNLLRLEDVRLCAARQMLVSGALVAASILTGARLTDLAPEDWGTLRGLGLVGSPQRHPAVPAGMDADRFYIWSGWDGGIGCPIDGPVGFWPGSPLDPEFAMDAPRPGESALCPQGQIFGMSEELRRAFARTGPAGPPVEPEQLPPTGTPEWTRLRHCHAQQLMLAGALVAYEIEHQRSLGELDAAAWDALVADGLLAARLADPGGAAGAESWRSYHRMPGWQGGIACEAHGAARFWPGSILDPALFLGHEDAARGDRINPQHLGPARVRDLHVLLRDRVPPPIVGTPLPAAPAGWMGRPGP